MTARYAAASTAADRLAIAVDFVRAAAAALRRIDATTADRVLADLTHQVLAGGEALLRRLDASTRRTR